MKILSKLSVFLAILLPVVNLHAVEKLNGAGATFPYPVYSAWAYEYSKTSGVQLNYQSIGSGGGIKQITDRTVDFGASDDPLKLEDQNKIKVFQFPAVIGGVVPVVNIEGIKDGILKLDSNTLSRIYSGDIKFWDDSAVAALNSDLKLPHSEITTVWRSDGSGTNAIFTHYLSEVSPDWKAKVGEGKSVKYPVGIGAKGNEGVANYVQRTNNSIGYVEFAYAKQNKLAAVQLKNSAGDFVAPSSESFSDAASSANFDSDKGFYVFLTNAPGAKSWPIAGATFILLAKEKLESNKKVVQFFEWAFTNGDKKAEELYYVPLPQTLKDKIRDYWKKNNLS